MKTLTHFTRLALAAAAALCILAPPAHAAPGGLDSTFGTGGKVTTAIGGTTDFGTSVALQSDGKILVAGYSSANDYDFALVRYNADGSLDTSFNGTGKVITDFGSGGDYTADVLVQSDGKIVVTGTANAGSGNSDFAVVRYNANGSLDTSFGGGTGKVTTPIGSGDDVANNAVLQGDGKIVLAGHSISGGNIEFSAVRYNSDGSLDTSFNGTGKVITDVGSGNSAGDGVALQGDGKIVMVGHTYFGSDIDFAVVRYNANGSLDTSFNGTGIVTTNFAPSSLDGALDVVVQSDGKIVVAGNSGVGGHAIALARYNADGTLDTSFNGTGKVTTAIGGEDAGLSVALQSNGKIVVAGFAATGSNNFALVRYNSDGSLDTSFNGNGVVTTAIGSGDDRGYGVVLQSDGKIVVAGVASIGGSLDFAVARYLVAPAPTQLTTSAGEDVAPRWHPTNNKIAYLRGTVRDVGIVNADGTGEALAASGLILNGYADALRWVGSTNLLMVAETNSIHELLALDTTQTLPVTRTSTTGAQAPHFAPKLTVTGGHNSNVMVVSRDGTRMAWRNQPNGGGVNSLTIRTALYSSLSNQSTSTHGTVIFSTTDSGTGTRGMCLTPTGDKLVIAIFNSPGWDLWLYNTDGSGSPVQLTNEAALGNFNGNPDISPDGTKILWQRGTATESDIWLMDLDGTDKVNITQTAGISENCPSWGPDGVVYAYSRVDGTTNNIYRDSLPAAAAPNTVTINFNQFPVGGLAGDALAGYGIPSVTFGGTGPGAGGMRIHPQDSNHIIPSPPHMMAQDGNSNDQNLTHFLRFNFTPELTAFSLKRIGKFGGGSTDTWRAYFYNAAGTLLGDFGESTPIINAPVTTFSFTAPVGQTIARMDLVSIWIGFATNRNIPVDDFVLTRSTAPADTTTQPPTLTSPATGTTTNHVTANFNLPEVPLAGSLKLLFTGAATRELTLAPGQHIAGPRSFTFDPTNPSGDPQIASISGGSTIPDGTYTVTLSYQDSLGNPAATATSTNVTLDNVTQAPTLIAPVTNAIITTSTLTVQYNLPEAAFAGSVRLVFVGAAGREIVLANSAGTPGAHTVTFSRANPLASPDVASITGGTGIPDGYPYQIGLKYHDALNNNEGSAGADFVRIDSTAPVVSVPANITAEATGSGGRVVTFSVSATDNVDGPTAATAVPPSGSTFAIGTTTVNVSATDLAGNVGVNSFTVTVQDTTPPVISGVPANITAEATGPAGRVVTFTSPTANDLVDGARPVVCVPASGSTFPIGTTTVICTSTDTRSNSSSGSFTVTVQDTTGPVISGVPANITAEATGASGRTVTFTSPTANDLVDGVRPVMCVPASGSTFPIGTTTVICTSTDTRSNSSSGSFTVTVQDTTGPVLSLPANMTVEATGVTGTAVVTFSATANDLVDGARLVTCVPPSGSTFNLGTTTVNCSASDTRGNTSNGSFTVTVQDTTPPAPPGVFMTDITLAMPTTPITASFTGWTDLSLPLSYSIRVGTTVVVPPGADSTPTFTLPVGTHSVTGRVFDAAGNFTDAGPITVVVDGMAPTITTPGNLTVSATSPAGAVVSFVVSATDDNDPNPTVVANPPSGSTFPIGTTTVNVTATDDAGNEATASFTVTVGQVAQTINFSNPGPHSFGDAPFALLATGGASGNPVTYIIVTGPATVSVSTLTITGVGDVTVRASQAGNAIYAAAADVEQTFTVGLASQTISFNPPATASPNSPITLSATGGGSGNPVIFSVVSGPATLAGSSLGFTGLGGVVVRASQAGNSSYASAANVEATITVVSALELVDDVVYAGSSRTLINVLLNDFPTGTLALQNLTQPASGGTVAIEAGKVRFRPSAPVSAPITFTYTATLGVDTATANVTIRPISEAVGSFVGLIRRTDNSIRGRVSMSMTSTGLITGSVRRESTSWTFKANLTGSNRVFLPSFPKNAPAPMSIVPTGIGPNGQAVWDVILTDTVPGQQLTGQVERSPYSSTNPAPQAGRYTITAPRASGGVAGPANGAAMTCVIASSGNVTMGGRLANSQAVTQGGRVLSGGRLPFYLSTGSGALYKRVAGELVFDGAASPVVDGTLRWTVPAGTPRLLAGLDQDYDVFGQPYVSATNASTMFDPSATQATLTLGLLPTPVTRVVSLMGTPVRGIQRVNFPGTLGRIELFTTNGFFLGLYSPSRGVNRTFFGVVLQGGVTNAGQGNVLDAASIGVVTLAP